ncbi:PDZ domain-containing protein [Mesorhizobium sp. M1163]|uniref:PDZ domain-containing protein n=1 Tax=Mesorhizobium sp. M1163 TaxID=2957065 RepID=UPI00333A2D6D
MQTVRKSRLIMQFARALATSVKMTAVVSVAVPHTINVAYASKYDLPKPYVSRALNAVLIPINHASRHRYQIPPKLRGVYVLAVAPHGVAARQGIRPGDVLATVRHQPISTPTDVDRLVWAALAVSATSFLFGVNRGTEVADVVEVTTNITVNNFNTNISVNNISQWTSVDNHEEWTQIVDQYDDEMETSLEETSYREDDSLPGDASPDANATSADADDDSNDSSADTDGDTSDESTDDSSNDQDDSSDQNDDEQQSDDSDDDNTDDDSSDDNTDNNSSDDQDNSGDQNDDEDSAGGDDDQNSTNTDDDSTDGDASDDSSDDSNGSDDDDSN